MVPFAGFAMPVQYTSIVDEHRAAREAAALFDVSHMGQIALAGEAAGAYADRLCTRAMGTLDGDPGVRAGSHMFVASKAPWDEISDGLPQYPEYGPMGG